MRVKILWFLILCCLFSAAKSLAQENLQVGEFHNNNILFEYRGEASAAFAGGEYTPFWLVSNIHGLGSPEFNNGFVRGEIFKRLSPEKKFDWGIGADITGGWNIPAPFAIRQLYAEMHYKALYVSFGSRNFESKYNDRRLSTGDLLFSGNAMAIPQLRVGTYGFAPFWGTNDWFSVNLYLAYGIFTDGNWLKHWTEPGSKRTSGVLFCSRGLSLRGGNPEKFPLTFDVGIEMGTQFGGTIYNRNGVIKMPHKFIDWLKAVIPLSGSEDTPDGEQTNVQGNMNGEYSISIAWTPKADWYVKGYWEHYFEDHSQLTFEYGLWKDGLWGIEVKIPANPFLSKFVMEYVATADQTGAVNHDTTPEIPEQISGRDGYYTHYIYGAWQNWGMTIGTPLAISPLYNKDHILTIYNSRFKAFHFGLEGDPSRYINWRMLLTFTQNWGTYIYPLPGKQNNFSGLIEATGHLPKTPGWFAKAAIAWDKGKLLGNNFGARFSIGYEGNFSVNTKKSPNSSVK